MPTRTSGDKAPVRKRMSAGGRRKVIETAATAVFGERGFHGASLEEIARRSGVTVPVIYDHFPSKRVLYQHLIEVHYHRLRRIWFEQASLEDGPGTWIGAAIDAWFTYVEHHPFAGRMLFRDTTGDPVIAAVHRAIQETSKQELLPLFARAVGSRLPRDPVVVELAWEALRSSLQGLALWWFDHPDVPREQVVAGAMNAVWIGLDRFLQGEGWGA